MITRIVNTASYIATPLVWVIGNLRLCGSKQSQFRKAETLLNKKDYSAAISILENLAAKGHAEAQTKLGDCYSQGKGVAQDDKAATLLWERAYQQGDLAARFNLAKYLLEKGTKDDRQKAVELLANAPLDKKNKHRYSIYAKLYLAMYYLELKELVKMNELFRKVNDFDSGSDALYRRSICSFILLNLKSASDERDTLRAEQAAIADLSIASRTNDRAKLILAMLYFYGSKFGSIKPNKTNRTTAKKLLMDLKHSSTRARFYLGYLLREEEPGYTARTLASFAQKNWQVPITEMGMPKSLKEEWCTVGFKDLVVMPTATLRESLIAFSKNILENVESPSEEVTQQSEQKTSHSVIQASLQCDEVKTSSPEVPDKVKPVKTLIKLWPSSEKISDHSLEDSSLTYPFTESTEVKSLQQTSPIIELVDMIVVQMKQVVLQEEKDFKMSADISGLVSLIDEDDINDFYDQDKKATAVICANIQQMVAIAPYKSFQLLKQFEPMLALFCPDLSALLGVKKQHKGQMRIEFLEKQLTEIEGCPLGERFDRAAVCILAVLAQTNAERNILKILLESPTMKSIGFSKYNKSLHSYCEEYAGKLAQTNIVRLEFRLTETQVSLLSAACHPERSEGALSSTDVVMPACF